MRNRRAQACGPCASRGVEVLVPVRQHAGRHRLIGKAVIDDHLASVPREARVQRGHGIVDRGGLVRARRGPRSKSKRSGSSSGAGSVIAKFRSVSRPSVALCQGGLPPLPRCMPRHAGRRCPCRKERCRTAARRASCARRRRWLSAQPACASDRHWPAAGAPRAPQTSDFGSKWQAWKSLIMPSRRPSSASHCFSTASEAAFSCSSLTARDRSGLPLASFGAMRVTFLQAPHLIHGHAGQVVGGIARDHAVELQRQALRGEHRFAAASGAAHVIE